MELKIDVELLRSNKLSLGQYIYLWTLYHELKEPYDISLNAYEYIKLLGNGFIYRESLKTYCLTDKGFDLFDKHDDLFSTFINEFPTRVMGKGAPRALSPSSPDTLGADKIKKKWNAITRRNTDFQQHIIACLKEEVKVRKNAGDLYWMRNAETWLNKATWEDYEYLLEQPTKEKTGFKVNEIKL
jgi:hypothetical protein